MGPVPGGSARSWGRSPGSGPGGRSESLWPGGRREAWDERATLPGGCTSGRSQTSRGNFEEVSWESAVPPASRLGCWGADNAESRLPRRAPPGVPRHPWARVPRVPVMCRRRGRAGRAAASWRLRPHRRRCWGSQGRCVGGAAVPPGLLGGSRIVSQPCYSLAAFDCCKGCRRAARRLRGLPRAEGLSPGLGAPLGTAPPGLA